ncbi:MAG: phosphatidylserine decarboxylase family protein [Candidatus Binatia bacterium]
MKIAREGYPLILTAGAFATAAFAAGWQGIGIIFVILALGLLGFFRDPERFPPQEKGLILAPADGKVVSIAAVQGDSLFEEARTRLSIFLSPLDVHVNRTPVEGKIEQIHYQPGKFFAAYKQEASRDNEQNALRIVDGAGRKVEVVQVAGVLARRIVCRVKKGDMLDRGQRFGLIMFGSRTDLYLPDGCRVNVTEGERVKGGETIVARFV